MCNLKSIMNSKIARESRRWTENPRDAAVFRGWRPLGTLSKKYAFLDVVWGNVCTKFQVCIVLVWSGGVTQINE